MSGQTVTGNSLQFTDDNKHAYAYSGRVLTEGDNTPVTRLEFQTNTEYIKGDLQLCFSAGNNDDLYFHLLFNDVIVAEAYNQTPPEVPVLNTIPIIIPPFTNVKIKIGNGQSATAREAYIIVIGKVGMPPRVGN
jgi:hypothetical protein